jgi:hypothetical protein
MPLVLLVWSYYNLGMKRIEMKTTIAKETRAGLERIAKREKLTDHGAFSKGRAIDYLVAKELAGSTKAGVDQSKGVTPSV